MKRYLITVYLLIFSVNTFAASGDGTVSNLVVGRLGNQVLVKLSGNVEPIECRTRTDWHYYLDLNNPGSREILSSLLLAKATSQNIRIQGTGACDTVGLGLENISYVVLN